jgi:hypothetical protein
MCRSGASTASEVESSANERQLLRVSDAGGSILVSWYNGFGSPIMTYRGVVKNGVVVFEGNPSVPDGTEVRVEPLGSRAVDSVEEQLSPLFRVAERAKPTGISDLAINHDHYLYGHPKVSGE